MGTSSQGAEAYRRVQDSAGESASAPAPTRETNSLRFMSWVPPHGLRPAYAVPEAPGHSGSTSESSARAPPRPPSPDSRRVADLPGPAQQRVPYRALLARQQGEGAVRPQGFSRSPAAAVRPAGSA